MNSTHDSAMQTQGQGHSLRSWDLPLYMYFVSALYLLNLNLERFNSMFRLVRWCAEPMT